MKSRFVFIETRAECSKIRPPKRSDAGVTLRLSGELAEWSKAAVLKTVESKGSGGSNPSLSAIFFGMGVFPFQRILR